MSTASDADDDQTGRFVRQPNGRIRPLSPHLQIWRWHITMLASILFRMTIGAASVGAILVIGWLGALAFGPEAHAGVMAFMGSPWGC
ncbi:succinate dehydrogenase, cytochrome b556 subunit [Brevundimonas denitrificans]|uniref:succinate dehydrogenase, cytochrome b556 subunit n=1 Tax=Brevundimonas denitrificans TaxID=1443434 RepID=UPI00223BA59D|nr:succinate:quinone oxidoreductase subunit C [Brevundimonas denitrificans]